MDISLDHARHDPSHCLAPGLFRSIQKSKRKKEKLDVTYSRGKDIIRFIGYEPLGADDLRLLQGIVALAGPAGVTLSPQPTKALPMKLRQGLAMEDAGMEMKALMLRATSGRLLAETGMSDGGANTEILMASLVRMSSVTVIVSSVGRDASFRLLSFSFDRGTRCLDIALNPHLAQSIVGEHPFTRINMSEVRKLKSDAARLIHQRLCGFVDQGKTQRVGFDHLCTYAWGFGQVAAATVRKRRGRILQALAEISDCGWTVKEYKRNKFSFLRPSISRDGPK